MIKNFLTDQATLKTISWRIIALTATVLVVWVSTGSIEIAASIGGIDAVIKTILYWLHEKVWQPRVGNSTAE